MNLRKTFLNIIVIVVLFLDIDLVANSVPSSIIQSNEIVKSSDFSKSNSGWINTVPLSNSSATLSRKSAKSRRVPMADNFVKSYLKKRNLILDLLVSKHEEIFRIISLHFQFTIWLLRLNHLHLKLV